MASLRQKTYLTKSEYNVVYSELRGVDLEGDGTGISRNRLAYSENLYRDYDGSSPDAIESIPGFRKINKVPYAVDGIFIHRPSEDKCFFFIHAGGRLYRLTKAALEAWEEPYEVMELIGEKINAFSVGECMYIVGGESLLYVNRNGNVYSIKEGSPYAYVPTTYINGCEHEQRNILTRECKESYFIGSASSMSFGTPGLIYSILSEEERSCRVDGINSSTANEIFIPERVKLGDKYYMVKEISKLAFKDNGTITRLHISEGLNKISYMAFMGCTALSDVSIADSVTEIGENAFTGCSALKRLHIGAGLKAIAESALSFCSALERVSYAGGEDELSDISGNEILKDRITHYNQKQRPGFLSIPVFGPVTEIRRLLIGGMDFDCQKIMKGELIREIVVEVSNIRNLDEKEAVIHATLSKSQSAYSEYGGFSASKYAAERDINEMLSSAEVAAFYDGRPFLGGCKSCPGVVFFASRDSSGQINPNYFGENDYFHAYGENRIISMLPCVDSLAIFSRDNRGRVAISYHTPYETDSALVPITYKRGYTHQGLGNVYASFAFYDDALFLSDSGVIGIDKQLTNLEKNITLRSGNINSKLLGEELERVKIDMWCGYLVLAAGERIYLADSRKYFQGSHGGKEYEWFLLAGIGTYENEKTVFRFSSVTSDEEYSVSEELCDTAVGEDETILSESKNGIYRYYVVRDGKKHLVHPTYEMRGGIFHPLSAIASYESKLLYFGTTAGDICIFNNDKRGVPTDAYAYSEDFSAEEYKRAHGREISPMYYSFAGHPVRYCLKSARDNGGIVHLEKSTVKHSLTVKCRAMNRGEIVCEVGTDKGGYKEICHFPSTRLCFDDIDFSSMSLSCDESYTRAISEKERGWVEKQITMYSIGYASPIAIHNIAYRFTVKGRIRKK